jgi:ribosomal protein S18 acetylase RimI-like enzyme
MGPCLLQRQCGRPPPPPPIALRLHHQNAPHQRARRRARSSAGGGGGVAARAAPAPASAPLTPEQQRRDTWMRNFSMEFELRPPPPPETTETTTTTTTTATTAIFGRVAPLPLALLPAAADLLAETFILSTMPAAQEEGKTGSSSLSSRPSLRPYARFVRRRIAKYLDDHVRPPSRTLVLAATVPLSAAPAAEEAEPAAAPSTPADLERQKMEEQALDAIFAVRLPGGSGENSSDNAASPPATAALVGTAELSLDATTRSRYLTLNPPDDACYLMNTAVAEPWRRRGVASALVRAADQVAAGLGADVLFLHARLIDPPAVALYESLGFEVVATDGWWVSLIGQDRRHLMKRRVQMGGGGGVVAAQGGGAAAVAKEGE